MNYETGEPASTPAAYAKFPPVDFSPPVMPVDDSGEPITEEWWRGRVSISRWFNLCIQPGSCSEFDLEFSHGKVLLIKGSDAQLTNVKTRGDLRELCRLLGVPMK